MIQTGAITDSRIEQGIPSQTPAAVPDAKLTSAAQQFEALFLKELLKPMQGDDDEQSGADANISGMATDSLAQGIAAHGGVGIARLVVQQLSAK